MLCELHVFNPTCLLYSTNLWLAESCQEVCCKNSRARQGAITATIRCWLRCHFGSPLSVVYDYSHKGGGWGGDNGLTQDFPVADTGFEFWWLRKGALFWTMNVNISYNEEICHLERWNTEIFYIPINNPEKHKHCWVFTVRWLSIHYSCSVLFILSGSVMVTHYVSSSWAHLVWVSG